jgi:hypothetical protein
MYFTSNVTISRVSRFLIFSTSAIKVPILKRRKQITGGEREEAPMFMTIYSFKSDDPLEEHRLIQQGVIGKK